MAGPCQPPIPPPFGYLCENEVGDPVVEDAVTVDGVRVVQGPLRFCGTGEQVCHDDTVSACISDSDGAPTSYGPLPATPEEGEVTGRSPIMSRVRVNREGQAVLPYSVANRPDQLLDIVIANGEDDPIEVPFNSSTGRFTLPAYAAPLTRCVDDEPLTGQVPNCLLYEDGETPVPMTENNNPLIPFPLSGCSYVIDEVQDVEAEDPLGTVGLTLSAGTTNLLIEKVISWTNDLGCPIGVTLKVEVGTTLDGITTPMAPGQSLISWDEDAGGYIPYASLAWSAVAGDIEVGTTFFSRETELGEVAPGATKTVQLKWAVNPGFNTPEVINGAVSFALVTRRLVIP